MATHKKSSKPKKAASKAKTSLANKKSLRKQRPAPAKKSVAAKKSPPVKKASAAKKASGTKKKVSSSQKTRVVKNSASKKKGPQKSKSEKPSAVAAKPKIKPVLNSFLAKQRQRLLALKDTLLDSMNGVAKDSLRSRADGSEASAFGQHQADAGSDAYDRDFALSLLSSEQDSLYEIDQALKRIEDNNYGVCEMSNKQIPQARLEALPFARYTVECQSEIEKRNRQSRLRQPITSLFGGGEDEGDGDEDDSSDSKE